MLRELSQLRPSLRPLHKPYGIAVRADMKNYPERMVSKAIGHRTGTSRSPHLPERVRNTKSQSSPLNVYFFLGGFQSSLLLIYFPRSECLFTLRRKAAETHVICNHPILRLARRSFATFQKSRRNHVSYVRTKVLPNTVFVSAQELSAVADPDPEIRGSPVSVWSKNKVGGGGAASPGSPPESATDSVFVPINVKIGQLIH